MLESEIFSSLENDDDSSSCAAIMKALDNKQNIDQLNTKPNNKEHFMLMRELAIIINKARYLK